MSVRATTRIKPALGATKRSFRISGNLAWRRTTRLNEAAGSAGLALLLDFVINIGVAR